ncbi:DUF924 family protein [Sphingomonas hengshuiensis]|uniref:DUF924 family protein n=1 Tax=Sphingomonas hengshuiensis TaxID=1609977 RepID=UPI0005C8F7D1|nr:DUF924 family protein [Sphingomonas hengshuiensis]
MALASDLGTGSPEVQPKARTVLSFWFEALSPEQHFTRSDSVDTAIREHFGALREELLATRAEGWRDDPQSLLAAVIVLDQFSRNLFRDDAEAFAADPLALELAEGAIDRDWDAALPPEQRMFLYMPLMHAEDPAVQAESVRCFTALGLDSPLEFARQHAEVIADHGRFPGRNAALGRESTPAEREYLSRPDVDW